MSPADCSVIIPALNEADNIERAIRSAQDAGAREIVVADGGSDDRTIEIARNVGALIVESEPGRGVQQNAGARLAQGHVLLFLHADNWLAPSALTQVSDAATGVTHVWGGMQQNIDAHRWMFRVLEWGNRLRIVYRGLPFGDQAIFVSTELFWQVGGFPDHPIMEDLALSRRLLRIRRPLCLEGPIYVNARRWQETGVIKQTVRNVSLQAAYAMGVSPARLAQYYRNGGD